MPGEAAINRRHYYIYDSGNNESCATNDGIA
jgi:hypothetical protein